MGVDEAFKVFYVAAGRVDGDENRRTWLYDQEEGSNTDIGQLLEHGYLETVGTRQAGDVVETVYEFTRRGRRLGMRLFPERVVN